MQRRRSIGQLDRDAQLLADAFADDPLFVHLLPDDDERASRLPWLMKSFLRLTHARGLVDRVDDHGLALWLPPRTRLDDASVIVRSGLVAAPARLGLATTRRLIELLHTEHDEGELADDWYLFILAVHPDARGTGAARRLVERGFRRADAQGIGVRLETNNPANVALYQHLGLTLQGQVAGPSGLAEWVLRRPPR